MIRAGTPAWLFSLGTLFLNGCGSDSNPSSAAAGAGGVASGGQLGMPGAGGLAGAGTARAGAGGAPAGGAAPAVGGNPSAGGDGPANSGGSSPGGAGGDAAGGSFPNAGGGEGTGSPAVRIVGRSAAGSSGAVRFSWPGVNLNARFRGTQVSMDLNDGTHKNRFTVVVDGGAPKTVTSPSGQSSLPLASGLTDGTHDLLIWRNTEAPGGVTQFSGLSNFGAGGALLSPPAAPDRRIEVIGDSLSAGAGVEGSGTSCSPNIDAFTNNYLAYGSIAARSVKADVVTIAWSGIGVYRSYSSGDPTMPARYDYAIPNDQSAWDFAAYQPHVVVINLGTNDFGSGNPGQPYVSAYVDFAKHVRSKYPSAHFILIDMYGGERLTAINNVVTALKNGGESKVQTLSFSAVPNNNTACNGHPNATAQRAMGDLLATRLKSLMSW